MGKAIKKLRLSAMGETRSFALGRIVVGRSDQADWTLPVPDLSRKHLEIAFEDGTLWIKDLGSSNGSFLKNQRLAPQLSYPLNSNETVNLANAVELQAEIVAEDEEAITSNRNQSPELPRVSVIRVPVEMPPPAGLPRPVESPRPVEAPRPAAEPPRFVEPPSVPAAATRSPAVPDESLIAAQRKLLETQAAAAEQEALLRSKEGLAQELQVRVQQLESRVGELQAIATECEDRSSSARRALAEVKEEHSEVLKLASDCETVLKQMEQSKRELAVERDQITSEIAGLHRKKDELQSREVLLERELQVRIQEREQKLSEALVSLERQRSDTQKNIDQLHSDLRQLRQDKDQALRLYADQSRQIQMDTLRLESEGSARRAKAEVELAELERRRVVALKKAEIAEIDLRRLSSQSSSLHESIQSRQSEVSKLEAKSRELEFSAHEFQARLKTIEAQIQNERLSHEKLIDQTRSLRDSSRQAEAELEKLKTQSEEWIAEHRKKAEAQAEATLKKARAELDNIEHTIEQERTRLLESSRQEGLASVERAKSEAQQLQAQAQREIALYKTQEKQKLTAFIENEISTHKERRKIENEVITRNLHVHLGRELKGLLRPEFEEKLPTIVEQVVALNHEILELDEVRLKERSLRHLKGGDPLASQLAQRKLFILVGKLSASLAIVFVLFFTRIPSQVWSWTTRALSPDQDATERRLAKIAEEREKSFYRPEQNSTWRESYTDNLIYLKGYAELKSDSKLSEKWTLEVNQFLMNELKLSERAVVQLMPIESELIRELTKVSRNLKTETLPTQLERMKNLEKVMVDRLGLAMGGEFNYPKFRALEERFYRRNVELLQRLPASD
jgi:pSer/pThr/pTyr-binding forkhead associated (FHA) protein